MNLLIFLNKELSTTSLKIELSISNPKKSTCKKRKRLDAIPKIRNLLIFFVFSSRIKILW